MTHDDALNALLTYLRDAQTYPVVALKGPWGSGKTYIWSEARAELEKDADARAEAGDEPGAPPLYCSLFGLESIGDVRTTLMTAHLQDTSPRAAAVHEKAVKFKEKFASLWGVGGTIGKGVGSVVDIASSAVSEGLVNRYLQGRLIVLDDLERRGDGLAIVTILGFIEFLRAQRCQVLVVFNEEKLGDEASRLALASFREKAFDIELQLTTEPLDAFRIALASTNFDFSSFQEEHARSAMELAEITNIRIAKRALAVAKHAYADFQDGVSDEVMTATMEAIAIATNIFYGGLPDAPALPVLNEYLLKAHGQMDPANDDPAAAEAIRQLLPGVQPGFLTPLFKHLQTGDLQREAFRGYWISARAAKANHDANLLAKRCLIQLHEGMLYETPKTLAGYARDVLPVANDLSPSVLCDLVKEIREIDKPLAREFARTRTTWGEEGESPFVLPPDLEDYNPVLAPGSWFLDDNRLRYAFNVFGRLGELDPSTEETKKQLALITSCMLLHIAPLQDFQSVLKQSFRVSRDFDTLLGFLKLWADKRVGFGAQNLGLALSAQLEGHTGTRAPALLRAYLGQTDALEIIEQVMLDAKENDPLGREQQGP